MLSTGGHITTSIKSICKKLRVHDHFRNAIVSIKLNGVGEVFKEEVYICKDARISLKPSIDSSTAQDYQLIPQKSTIYHRFQYVF